MVTSEGTNGLSWYIKTPIVQETCDVMEPMYLTRWSCFFSVRGAWLLNEPSQGIGLGGFSHPKASGVEPLVTLGPKSFKAENLP